MDGLLLLFYHAFSILNLISFGHLNSEIITASLYSFIYSPMMSWSPKVDYFFTTSNKFLSVQPVTFTNSVDDFKTSAEFTDYLMSVALIKTATII